MKKILVPVDPADPARTREALQTAVRIYAQGPVDVHLLSVQPLLTRHVAMFFGGIELQNLQHAAGDDDLAAARETLAHQNVPCSSSVRIGRSAETIARTARELGCDRIVMGPDGVARLADKVFGTLAQQVRHLLGATGDCQVIGS